MLPRGLVSHPLSSAAIIVTLAMGIGATTAIHAAFSRIFARGAPGVADPDRVISVFFRPPHGRASAYGSRAAVPGLRRSAPEIEHLAYWRRSDLAVQAPAGAVPTVEQVEFVSAGYFAALGVQASVGRLLSDDDVESGASQAVVISEALWRSRFGADAAALGRTIDVAGHRFDVIGVADQFRGPTRVDAVDLWLPIGLERLVTGVEGGMSQLVGRVAAETSLPRLQERLRAAYTGEIATLPGRYAAFVPFVEPAYAMTRLSGPLWRQRGLYQLLMAGALSLLILACANAAAMLIARAGARGREMAVRLALGAGPARLAASALGEAGLLALLAGAFGVAAAILVTRVLGAASLIEQPALDLRVLLTCLGVTLGTTLACGLVPAAIAARRDLRSLIDRGGPTLSPPHRRVRSALAIAGIVVSVLLVSGAALLNTSLRNLLGTDLGIRVDGVLTLTLEPELLGYRDADADRVREDVVAALRAAGFQAVALAEPGPLTDANARLRLRMTADAPPFEMSIGVRTVSPDYFRILALTPVAGRTLEPAEYPRRAAADMPVVLSESLARQLFGASSAVGRRFEMEWPTPWPLSAWVTVVGVVGDTRAAAVRGSPWPTVYHPGRPSGRRWVILLESQEPVVRAVERVRSAVSQVDARLPVSRIEPLEHQIAAALAEDRALARLSGFFAVLASLVAVTGMGALIWQLAMHRRREFAIRLAIGAPARRLVTDVFTGALKRSAIGFTAGIVMYALSSSWLATRLFGVDALDAPVIARALGVLFVATCLAALPPAFLAARVDPAATLRNE